jgi:MFS family permease
MALRGPRPATLAPVRVPGVQRTLVLSLLARIPIGAFGLLLVLAVRHAGHSYALAGLTSGACALGVAAGAPVQGRLMDRIGHSAVLLVSAAGTAVTFAALGALTAASPSWAFLVLATLCGVVQPPVSPSVRVIWHRLLGAEAFATIIALDASLQELAFLTGPVVLVTVATQLGPPAALVFTGLAWGATTAAFALLSETRAVRGDARPQTVSALGPIRDGGARTLLIVAVGIGACIGASELGVARLAEAHHARDITGLLFAAWSLGSFAAGLVAAGNSTADPVGRMQRLLVLLTLASGLLVLAPSPAVLAPMLALAGAALAPLFGVLFTVMADITPPSMATEAFTLQTAALTIGIASGTAGAGVLANAHGAAGAFTLAAVVTGVGAAALHARRAALRCSVAAIAADR